MNKQAELAVLAALMAKYGIKTAPKASKKPAIKTEAKPKASAPKWDVEAATVAAFAKAGVAGAKPRVDVLTHKAWEAKGFRVRKGQKAVFVKKPGSHGKGLPLFHQSQVEPLAA